MKQNTIKLILLLLLTTISSKANITVYFYGIESANEFNSNPSPISLGPGSGGFYLGGDGGVNLAFAGGFGQNFFHNSNRISIPSGRAGSALYYSDFGGLQNGAEVGYDNFVYMNFGGGGIQEPFESIGQFYFDNSGNGWLVAVATTNSETSASDIIGNDDGRRITVSEGATAIQAAIPEPREAAIIISLTTLFIAISKTNRARNAN